ncbi:hypothetical protein [Brevifollis gellanilyticus]|uniref:Uncharacterized protein n=1 Tax=Brevifollis gellanilyticus TaxID=748831 RepID=A0A512MJF5_9BACT|nr:hypothetical protein [Brevifollis gellanilyticus]GEP46421.1 hypothetical protein BGE01nite_57120 [Brevifollis gellanilyticus]
MKPQSKSQSKSEPRPGSKRSLKQSPKAPPKSKPSSPTSAPAAGALIPPPPLATQLQERGLMQETLRHLLADRPAGTPMLKKWKSAGIIATEASLRTFLRDHAFLHEAQRAQRLQGELLALTGLSPAQTLRLIIAQRLLEGASEDLPDLRDLLQTATHLLREDQMHRSLDQKDEAIQLQRRRIETLEAKVQEAASLTENAELTEQDRISQIRAIFGR